MMPSMSNGKTRFLLIAIVVLTLVSLLAGCGGDDQEGSVAIDKSFIQAMVPHHAMAIQSAQYQYENGDDKQSRELARDIVNSQMAEVSELDRIGKQLGVKSDPVHLAPLDEDNKDVAYDHLDATTKQALKTLGLTREDAGMNDKMIGLTDSEWVEAMTLHHHGATVISKIQVEQGSSAELKSLANNMIATQSRETGQLGQLKP